MNGGMFNGLWIDFALLCITCAGLYILFGEALQYLGLVTLN